MRKTTFLMTPKIPFSLAPVAAALALATLSSCSKPAESEPKATPTPAPSATATPAAPAAAATTSTPSSTTPPAAVTDASGIKDPVAVVNGEPITKAQLDEAFETAVKSSGMKAADLTAEQKLQGYNQILDDLIMDKLVSAAAQSVQVSQADIDAELAKIKGQFPNPADFDKQLADVGQTQAQLTEQLKKVLQQQKWVESQVGAKVDVTPDEAQKFYDANKAEFQEPDTVKASHILFLVKKDDSDAVVKAQLAKAQKAEARAKKGEDFTKLAKELSEEPGAKESGGDLGFFSKDRMVPEFANAAFTQKVGTVGDPVRTQFGWHVIKVTDKKPAGTVSFDKVKDQLIAYLKQDKQRKAVQELLKSLRDSAKIQNNLPPAPEPAAAPAGLPGAAAPEMPSAPAPAATP